jgi:hypothetical protein
MILLQKRQEVFVASGAQDSNLMSAIRIQQQQQFQTASWTSFEEYKNSRNSVRHWTIVNDNFNCNCPVFMKPNLCKHSLGMEIRLSVSDPPPEAKNVPLGQKKKRGRPKLSKPALPRQ